MRPHYRSAKLYEGHTIHWIELPDGTIFDTRATRWIEGLPLHKRLQRIEDTKDALAFRKLMLDTHGLSTVQAMIRKDRGHPSID